MPPICDKRSDMLILQNSPCGVPISPNCADEALRIRSLRAPRADNLQGPQSRRERPPRARQARRRSPGDRPPFPEETPSFRRKGPTRASPSLLSPTLASRRFRRPLWPLRRDSLSSAALAWAIYALQWALWLFGRMTNLLACLLTPITSRLRAQTGAGRGHCSVATAPWASAARTRSQLRRHATANALTGAAAPALPQPCSALSGRRRRRGPAAPTTDRPGQRAGPPRAAQGGGA